MTYRNMQKRIFITMFETLFSPMKIGSMAIKNRVVMAAAEFSLGQPNGKPTDQMMDYFEERAKGGVGMIIPGICRVNDMGGASTFTQLSMSHDYHIEPMRIFAERIHQYGSAYSFIIRAVKEWLVPQTHCRWSFPLQTVSPA